MANLVAIVIIVTDIISILKNVERSRDRTIGLLILILLLFLNVLAIE